MKVNAGKRITVLWLTLCLLWMQGSALCVEIDMKPYWNESIALENPHKGWYHHYPDNHINKYIIEEDAHLLDFPGMDHIYIRLAWAYLEPQEGRFNWDVIDSIIDKWVGKGLKIAFRISCKETSTDRIEQQYATPKWVMDAGAKGDYYRRGKKAGPDGPWEPVFDDPVFLEKLENFLRAFARRYDGKSWIRYVDVGSIGDWGEGHTSSGSQIEYGYDKRKIHVDLYCKYFQKTQIVISDDFVYCIRDLRDRQKMHQYILKNGITYRDDSILVNGYLRGYSDTYTVRSPEFFADVWRVTPTVFELEHYGSVKRYGNWLGRSGSSLEKYGKGKTGADFFRGALALLHATYIGYHGSAHEWLTENPDLTVELLNHCGYWYFLHRVNIPNAFRSGQICTMQMSWENRGVAPAYHPYRLKIKFEGPKIEDVELDAGNRKWMPEPSGGVYTETYSISIPKALPPGKYMLKFKLYSNEEEKDVFVALDPERRDGENYYSIAAVNVTY
jgi:hypothetical protein